MSQVALQADVGNLSLTGLSAFSKLLSILTADDVTPSAMIEMENLGSLFHISGEHARKVPDLLSRSSSTRLDRLGIYAGWRKGDAASLMASSAGGQAISLLSNCIFSLYSDADAGEIFYQLSQKALSSDISVSSVPQLVGVGQLLHDKLQTLGFGNILAREVTKVHAAYEYLNKPVPRGFLDDIPVETMIELCHALTQVFREPSNLLRIRGSAGMGHLLGIAMLMFPQDTLVTLDGFIIHQGPTKSILLEFDETCGHPEFHIESIIGGNNQETKLRIEVDSSEQLKHGRHYCFKWEGWLADLLQLAFLNAGLTSSEVLLRACCDVITLMPQQISKRISPSRNSTSIPSDGFLGLLGPYPYERMQRICQQVFRLKDYTMSQNSIKEAYNHLQKITKEATVGLFCSCGGGCCSSPPGWHPPKTNIGKACKLYRLWAIIGSCLDYGFACLFINAGEDTAITHPELNVDYNSIAELITRHLNDESNAFFSYCQCQMLHSKIMRRTFNSQSEKTVASSNSSTLYLTAICTLETPRLMAGQYSLVDGKLVHKGRYRKGIASPKAEPRRGAKTSLPSRTQEIIPSHVGEHDTILLTLRDRLSGLEIQTTIQVGGQYINLDLHSVITSSWGLEITSPCEHSTKTPLAKKYNDEVITTSVAAPGTNRRKVTIVQVSGNPVAQFLSCHPGTDLLLQVDCCLSCAVDQAVEQHKTIICG